MKWLLLLLSLSACEANEPIKVAVIDTGIYPGHKDIQCRYGSRDFTSTSLDDTIGHGTNISGLIDREAKGRNYCQIVMKYYDSYLTPAEVNLQRTIDAFEWAIYLNVDVINYSSYGHIPDIREKATILKALNKGIKIFVPSGNEYANLDKHCNIFPTCYDSRMMVVGRSDPQVWTEGNGDGMGKIVKFLENGYMQVGFAITMSGTSQATAISAGKWIRGMQK